MWRGADDTAPLVALNFADEGAVVAESELAGLVSTPNESYFAADVASLVPRHSELHECRVDLDAEELD